MQGPLNLKNPLHNNPFILHTKFTVSIVDPLYKNEPNVANFETLLGAFCLLWFSFLSLQRGRGKLLNISRMQRATVVRHIPNESSLHDLYIQIGISF